MFSEKVKIPSCGAEYWVEYKRLYLPIIDNYFSENFFERDYSYYIITGSYVSRMVSGYGLSGIDANDLFSEIFIWFWNSLQEYNFEELITENFEVERDAYVYNKLRSELHNHLKYLRVRHRQIPASKRHKMEKYRFDYSPAKPKIELDLSELNPTERLVIDSYYYENLKIKEITHILGKSESTVKRIKADALRRLASTNRPLD